MTLREFRALVHVPIVDEEAQRLTGGCIPGCSGCKQEAAVRDLVAAVDAVLDYEHQPSRTALSRLREVVNG